MHATEHALWVAGNSVHNTSHPCKRPDRSVLLLLQGSNKSYDASHLQEMSHVQAAKEEEEEVLPTTQVLQFDLGHLRASFKRRREDALALHVDTPGSKKGRFQAASLQVSNPVLVINIITTVYQLLHWLGSGIVAGMWGLCDIHLPNAVSSTSALVRHSCQALCVHHQRSCRPSALSRW